MTLTSEQEQEFAQVHLARTLDETVPELAAYLEPGVKVLAVGCGPGTITMGVARVADPGQVVGVDPVPYHIQLAADLAGEENLSNALFQVADGYALPFPDDTFDLVYSHTVLHYFFDPERALREQRRVAKQGAWVVAAGVRDWGLVTRHPPCPAWDAVVESRGRWSELVKAKGFEKLDDRAFGHTQAARKCPEWFDNVGLKDMNLTVKPWRLEYPDAEGMAPNPYDFLPWEEPDKFGMHAQYAAECAEMVSAGLLDEETIRRAMDEAKAWYKDRRAFHFYCTVTAAGRA